MWHIYDVWGMIMCCLGIMGVWLIMCKWQVEYVLNCEIAHVLRCCVHWVETYEPYNHTTIRPFKDDEYCDGIHYGNPMSLVTLRHDEFKLFWEQLRSRVFCTVHRYSQCAKIFFGLDLNQEREVPTDSLESRPWR